jgi:predicted membrane-bound spermidine synthase
MLNHRQAVWFLFLEGFASIAIQFLILRQVTPFVGSSVIIVSLVVSLFLGALAAGYRRGGRVTREHTAILSRNLFRAALLLGLLGSSLFVLLLFRTLDALHPVLVLLLYLVVVMVPMVYFVAQTIPILVNSMRAAHSGQQAGDALLYSTIGNVIGGITTTVVVMYFLGVAWAITFTAAILISLSLIIAPRRRRLIGLSLLLLPLIVLVNVGYAQYKFVAQTPYADYAVYETNTTRYFISNRGYASAIDLHTGQAPGHNIAIKKIIRAYHDAPTPPKVLILGAGGLSLSAAEDLNASLHYVDIDDKIREIAQKHFLRKKVDVVFTGRDARAFLHNSDERYDFIVVDAYQNRHTIPQTLTTVEFYRQVRDHLAPKGLMLSNLVADPFLDDDFSRRMDRTIRAPFGPCFTHLTGSIRDHANILYVCQPPHLPPEPHDTTPYTDNDNRSTVDFFLDRLLHAH